MNPKQVASPPLLTPEESKQLKEMLEAERSYYPADAFSPLLYRKLPKNEYNIICTSLEQKNRMDVYGKKLRSKHPNWPQDKLMRKVFEEFPSVKIQLKTNHEHRVPGAGEENPSGDN